MTGKDVLNMIGGGMPLCISEVDAFCIDHLYSKRKVEVDLQLAKAVVLSNAEILCVAEKDRVNNKLGWSELGLPGETHNIYRMIQ